MSRLARRPPPRGLGQPTTQHSCAGTAGAKRLQVAPWPQARARRLLRNARPASMRRGDDVKEVGRRAKHAAPKAGGNKRRRCAQRTSICEALWRGCLLAVPEDVDSYFLFLSLMLRWPRGQQSVSSVGRCNRVVCVQFRQVFQQRIRPSSTLASRWLFAWLVYEHVGILTVLSNRPRRSVRRKRFSLYPTRRLAAL